VSGGLVSNDDFASKKRRIAVVQCECMTLRVFNELQLLSSTYCIDWTSCWFFICVNHCFSSPTKLFLA
jgi:hypothetical protein